MATGVVYKTRKLNKDSLIKMNSQQNNISLATGLQTLTIPLQSYDGYTPLAIVGFYFWNASSGGTGCSYWIPRQMYFSGNTLYLSGRNYSTGTIKIGVTISVLYKRQGI